MLDRILAVLFVVILLGAGLVYVLTMPDRLDAATLPDPAMGDATRGEAVFWAGGCASCHAPSKAEGDDKLKLGGGDPIRSDFGVFHAPNISPDPEAGIGRWRFVDFANAMKRGLSPDGEHLYPAFPYTSYVKMTDDDLNDLWAFLRTLPPVTTTAPSNDLTFPFNVRRGVGLWKLAFMDGPGPIVALPEDASEAQKRGRYLVEGPGHCGQCHTPRLLYGAGGLDDAHWLQGAPNPDGEGRIPNITPSDAGIGSWSASDIAYYLESGFTPDFDSVGGSMADVQENIARLPASDREAIAAYLKVVPAADERQGD